MAQKYVSDIIGEEYRQWKKGERILISTTTGSGKTHFILHKLLRHAKEQGKHLVYFCNRKFLSLQVQAAARKALLNELGEDEEGLAAHLHIRTYQHSEHVHDYPDIKALDEDGKVIPNELEIRRADILYYVYDEAFYVVADAGFNVGTHYWWDTVRLAQSKDCISVFLAATPKPLLLYLRFASASLDDLCKKFLAMYYINNDSHTERWLRYLCPGYFSMEKALENSPPWQWQATEAYLAQIREVQQNICQNPFRDFFSRVEEAYNPDNNLLSRRYQDTTSLAERYDHLNVHYFDDMAKLSKLIADSVWRNRRKETTEKHQRWLVFIDSHKAASSLNTSLSVLGCPSVVINSDYTKGYDGSVRKRRSTKRRVFDALIHEERLDCDVLISTPVLDCGITLRASNVSNLVICQPNQTSFLQMLGRIRVQEGERVDLYIQCFSPREIKGYKEELYKKFLYLVQLSQMNDLIHSSTVKNISEPEKQENEEFFANTEYFLPESNRKALLDRLSKDGKRKNYTYDSTQGSLNRKPMTVVNKLAILNCLVQLYQMEVVLPKYEHDSYYFLKEQLRWIGKTYDFTRWIDYDEAYNGLYAYLEEKRIEGPMGKEAQEEFRENCLSFLKKLKGLPDDLLKMKSRYNAGSTSAPSVSSLNRFFHAFGIPYQIKSKPSKKVLRDALTGEKVIDPVTGKAKIDNTTYWRILPVDLEEARKQEEMRKQEKLRKSEERKRQKELAALPAPLTNDIKKGTLQVRVRRGGSNA